MGNQDKKGNHELKTALIVMNDHLHSSDFYAQLHRRKAQMYLLQENRVTCIPHSMEIVREVDSPNVSLESQ